MDFQDHRAPSTIENSSTTDELSDLVHAVIAAHGIEPNISWDELVHELMGMEGTQSLVNFLGRGIERWEVLIRQEDAARHNYSL